VAARARLVEAQVLDACNTYVTDLSLLLEQHS
jgi:hypothetical protein